MSARWFFIAIDFYTWSQKLKTKINHIKEGALTELLCLLITNAATYRNRRKNSCIVGNTFRATKRRTLLARSVCRERLSRDLAIRPFVRRSPGPEYSLILRSSASCLARSGSRRKVVLSRRRPNRACIPTPRTVCVCSPCGYALMDARARVGVRACASCVRPFVPWFSEKYASPNAKFCRVSPPPFRS